MIFNQHHLRRGDVGRILPPGVIFWGAPLLVEVDTTSTKLTTNRCWTRAMGGEQETHIGGFSLIKSDQDKDDLQKKRNYIKYSSTFFLYRSF